MNAVAIIIRRHLLAREAVLLPEVGTLQLIEQSAMFTNSGRRMAPATKELTLTEQAAPSVIEYIMWETDLDENQAQELYDQWWESSMNGTRLIIDGVCTILLTEDYAMETDSGFWSLMNPLVGERIVVNTVSQQPNALPIPPMPKKSNGMMVIAIIFASLAALYLIYYFRDTIIELVEKTLA